MKETDEGTEGDSIWDYHTAEEWYSQKVVEVHLPEVVRPRLDKHMLVEVFDKVAHLKQRVPQ